MDGEFKIMIASDDEHERVFAEIYLDDKFVALVSQERGPGEEEVELPGGGLVESLVRRKVPLRGLEKALLRAAQRLKGE